MQEQRLDGSSADLWSIAWLGIGPDSAVIVAHAKNATVTMLSGAGSTLSVVGRKGGGPGEFRRVSHAGWVGDTVWVSDTELRRVTLLSLPLRTACTLSVGSVAVPKDPDLPLFRSYGLVRPLAVLPDGEMLVQVDPSMTDAFRSPTLVRGAILRVTRDGKFREFITALPVSEHSTLIRITGSKGGVGINPFGWESIWDVAPTGEYIATAQRDADSDSSFNVVSMRANGDTVFVRRFVVPLNRASRSEVDSIWAAQTAGVTEQALLNYYASLDRTGVHPPVLSMRAGRDGSVWIQLRPFGELSNPWLALSADGQHRGLIDLPEGAKIAVAHGDMVWATETDADGFVSITRFRVSPTNADAL